MIRAALVLLLAPLAAEAQLQFFIIDGSTTTPVNVGGTYNGFAPLGAGESKDFVVQVLNTGAAPLPLSRNTPALSGSGFSITSPLTPPPNIPPQNSLNVFIHFSGGPPASYSASLQITYVVGSQPNTASITLVMTVVPSATLTSASPCTGPDSTNTVNFGNISESQTATCSFQLVNESAQTVTVSNVAVAGTGFLFATPAATPLTLPAGGSSGFAVKFAPNSAASYSGTLTIDGQQFKLTGTAFNPPLPTPELQLDTNNPQSGQQVTLTMTFPTPSPIAASGSVALSFQPNSGVTAKSDPNIFFVSHSAQTIGFSIAQGSTQAMFNGQPGAVFQTGTTAGTVTFTVALNSGAQFTASPTQSLTLPPMAISVDQAAATSIAGALRIQVWGFDNSYSAGPMAFTFYDINGIAIGSGPVTADFTSNFRSYFSSSTDGGSFAMLVTFPITGNAANVGSVDVQLTNSAGITTITNLAFLNDTGQCILVNNVLTCPPLPSQ